MRAVPAVSRRVIQRNNNTSVGSRLDEDPDRAGVLRVRGEVQRGVPRHVPRVWIATDRDERRDGLDVSPRGSAPLPPVQFLHAILLTRGGTVQDAWCQPAERSRRRYGSARTTRNLVPDNVCTPPDLGGGPPAGGSPPSGTSLAARLSPRQKRTDARSRTLLAESEAPAPLARAPSSECVASDHSRQRASAR